MDLSRKIDGYCERIGPEFWSEPVNAVTNLAFLIAAILAVIAARRAGRLDGNVALLAGILAAISIGSFLFHTHATLWAALADTIPIMLFILAYFATAMNRYLGMGWWRAMAATLGMVVAMVALSAALRGIGPYVNNSQSYFPALLALFVVGFLLWRKGHPAGAGLIGAGGLFALSLTFRSIDPVFCAGFPLGTHFLWHLLNAVLLGWLLMTLIRHGARPAST